MRLPIEKRLIIALLLACGFAGCDGWSNPWSAKPPSPGGEDPAVTIVLYRAVGPKHVEVIKYVESETRRRTGWKNLYVVHEENCSVLYWGRYKSVDEAQKDLKRAKAFVSKENMKPFGQAMIVVVPGKDVGNPEWDLRRAKGHYSVLVAIFYDVFTTDPPYVGRKRFAAEYCRLLREEGFEAYYYHDTTRSGVTIGAFPESAVVKSKDKTKPLIYRDPRIERILNNERFKRLAVNGRSRPRKVLNTKTGQTEIIEDPSYVIVIPGKGRKGAGRALREIGTGQP